MERLGEILTKFCEKFDKIWRIFDKMLRKYMYRKLEYIFHTIFYEISR